MLLFYIFLIVSILGAVLWASQLAAGAMMAVWGLLLGFGIFLSLIVLFLAAFYLSTLFVDLSREQKKRSGYFSFLIDQFLYMAVLFAGVRIHAKGLEQVPRTQPFLLVSNHICDFDPVIFLRCMPWAKLGFISKKENYTMFMVNKVMHSLHCLPIDRENDREALKTIVKTAQILRTGDHSMAVFPEGYESKTGELLPFRNGVFKIAQRAEVPIVVAVLRGSDQIPKNIFRRRTDVEMEILGVVPVEELSGILTRDVGNRIHEMMEIALRQEETS